MSGGRWFSGELRAGAIITGRILLAVLAIVAGCLATFDWFWSEGHWSSYGEPRPWPFMLVVAPVSGWLAVRRLFSRKPKSSGDEPREEANL